MTLIPRTLVSRTITLTLFAIIFAQAITTSIWYVNERKQALIGIEAAATNMANMFASTVQFFDSLPIEYRHIVLDQIRNMGGTRHFVSFNQKELSMQYLPASEYTEIAISSVKNEVNKALPQVQDIVVNFALAKDLKILKDDIYLDDLPKSWAHHTLTVPLVDSPIMVVQLRIAQGQWIYIAALLPSPYTMLGRDLMPWAQLQVTSIATLIVLLTTFLMLRRQVKPLKRLAGRARSLSFDSSQPPLKEEGVTEVLIATRAFNRMQQRIQAYIRDRETLFSAISHDLKTPITRLRLRTELLVSDEKRMKFTQDLDELELMVKGALQCVKETDLHENVEPVHIGRLIKNVAEVHNHQGVKVVLPMDEWPALYARPLALKRALTNLIDNGVKYGHRVTVRHTNLFGTLFILLQDDGPGIAEKQVKRVFQPYVRIADDSDGHGLGLGIAQNIIHGHGGELLLKNRRCGGLNVWILLPLEM
ncbi:ATP-binding protein [Vibrio ulleungensis]|uniref:histidine kinase n=1 Tax=Vibrio ulleungensis TaxID=2807619 RepID=A0ABS2HKJ7_9VIBR|nr:ATP-binding protein [Vibrio ulleungensis]MBM7036372.1 HAMP domain-containing protein [Vibrio ulleungensis]